MSHLIQKHQQNKKGSGVIRRQYITPEQAAEFDRQRYSYTTVPSDNTRVVSSRVQVAPANTPEKVSKRYTTVQTNKAFKTAAQIDKERKTEQQYNQAAQQTSRSNPKSWVRDWSRIPLAGIPATIAEALYAGGNYLAGNTGTARYWWQQSNQDATGHTIALGAIPAHTNPYTAALYDGTLLGTYMHSLDEQGKLQHPERLTGEDKIMTAMGMFPYIRFENPALQARYLRSSEAEVTHPFMVSKIQSNPEIAKYVRELDEGVQSIPTITLDNNKTVPLIRSTTGEPVSVGSLIALREASPSRPHQVVLKGIRPVEGEFYVRPTYGAYNFTSDNRWNASQYAYLGKRHEIVQRLKDYGFSETSPQYKYVMNQFDVIDALNQKYKTKNYAYPSFANTERNPMDRTGQSVDFSMAHLIKNKRGKQIEWTPQDIKSYTEAMDRISQFWGRELSGGGVKELLIPGRSEIQVSSFKPFDYKDLAGHSYIDLTKPKINQNGKLIPWSGNLSESIIDMNKFGEWASDNGVYQFMVKNVKDPVQNTTYASRHPLIWGYKKGQKILKKTKY